MTQTLVLVHTVPSLIDAFDQLCHEVLPDVRVLHVLDEPMLERIRQRGMTTTEDAERLAQHAAVAEGIGADAVLVTCSTVSLCVDAIQDRSRVPVVKIDHAMAVEAVRVGTRIAVLATAATTLAPSREMLLAEGRRVGKLVEISTRLVDEGSPARLSGDMSTHDRLIERAVLEEAERSDVVVLAQASMASALVAMGGCPVPVPVLSSPRLALQEVRQLLQGVKPART